MGIKSIVRKRIRHAERGAALVLISLSLVAVVGTTGVIVDGGSAFAARRQMQNAADAAAMAGARALDHLAVNAEGAVWTAVLASATGNGADSSEVTCRFMTELLVDLGSCPTGATGTAVALKAATSAIKVTVGQTKSTTFTKIVGINNYTARANATAQIEALATGMSPFVLCATGNLDPRSYGNGQTIPILLPDNTINPSALGVQYALQDSNVVTCGLSSNNFKGLSNDFNSNPVPGAWTVYNGNHGANVSSTVVAGNNACRGTLTTGCILMVPLCHGYGPDPTVAGGTPQNQTGLYCERFGGFQVNDVQGQSRIGGVLVDQINVTGGQGGGHAQAGEIRIIKLSA
jgi:Flp pilus assembly protein TadG